VRSTVGWLDSTGTVVVVAAAEGMSSILAAAAAVLWPGVSGPDAAAGCCVSVLGVGEGCCCCCCWWPCRRNLQREISARVNTAYAAAVKWDPWHLRGVLAKLVVLLSCCQVLPKLQLTV
jgi:hypothetical protein